MGETVETAIYKLRVDDGGTPEQAAAGLDRLAASEDRVTVSTEKVTRATRTQSDAMSRMLARLDPRIRAEQQLQSALAQVNRFEEEGIGTVAQRSQAMTAATRRYEESIRRIKGSKAEGTFLGAANAAKLSTFQMQNMAFQMNDIGVMLASGQSPFVLLMQQGMQIAQIFGPGVGVAAAMKATGAALVSFVTNPLTLAVVGIAAAAGAVSLLFDAVGSGGKGAEQALERHAELVKRIKDRYGETDDAAKRYLETLDDLQFDRRSVLGDLNKQLAGEFTSIRATLDDFRSFQADIFSNGPLTTAIDGMVESMREGRFDVIAFNAELKEVANSDPTNSALQGMVKWMLEITAEATKAASAVRGLNTSIISSMDVAGRLASSSALAQQDMANYAKFVNETAVTLERLNEAHAAEIAAIGAKSPAQKAAAAAEAERISLIGQEITQEEKALRIAQAGAKARAQAEYELSEALRQRVAGMDESVAVAELEFQTLGKSAGEVARLTTAFQLLAAAKRAAIESGTVVSEEEVAKIMDTADAIAALTDRLTKLKIARDIAYERGLIGLTDKDSAIATRLRDIYGDDIPAALGSAEAAALRFNDRLKEIADVSKSMRDSLQSAIEGVFTGGIKSAGEFLDSITKGIAAAAAKLIASRFTDKLFGGSLAPVDAAGMQVATALGGAATKVTTAAPALANAAASLERAAGSLTTAGGGIGAGLSSGVGVGGSALSAANFNVRAAAAAIKSIESLGSGGYSALGRVIANGDRAYGAYQVMGNNISAWTKAALGYSMTNQQFLASAEAQDKVFAHQFGLLVNKFGNVSDAASAWFTGQPLSVGGNRADINGMTGNTYVDRFNKAYVGGAANDNAAPASIDIASVGGATVNSPADLGGLGGGSETAGAFKKLHGVLSSPMFQQGLAGFSLGYQSRSPLVGGLGGAATGFMAGGPIGALVGGGAGILGGIFGKSRAEREAAEAAKAAWEAMAGQVRAFKSELNGGGGSLADAIDTNRAKFETFKQAAEEAGKGVGNLEEDLKAFERSLKREFRSTFDGTLAALRSGAGLSGGFAQGIKDAQTLSEELLNFVKDAKTAFGSGKEVRQAKRAARDAALDVLNGGADEGSYTAEFNRLQGAATVLKKALKDLGMTSKEAGKAVRTELNQALVSLRNDFAGDLIAKINDASGLGYNNDVADLIAERVKLLEDAATIGADPTLVQQYFKAQAQEIVNSAELTGAAFDDLIATFPQLTGVVHQFVESAEADARALQESINSTGLSITEYLAGILGGSQSTLSPVDRLSAAQSTFDSQIALAQGGDLGAQQSITRYAEDLRSAARDFYASGTGYQAIFDQITQDLLNLPAVQGADDPVVVELRATLAGILEGLDLQTASLAAAIETGNASAVADALLPLFEELDVGGLTFTEMKAALGPIATDAQLKAVFSEIDINGNGTISKLESILASNNTTRSVLQTAILSGPAAIATALAPSFDAIDLDVSGGITFAEMKAALGGLASDAQLQAVIAALDSNGDGQISQLELIKQATQSTNSLSGSINSSSYSTATNTGKQIVELAGTDGVKKWAKSTALVTKAFAEQTVGWLPVISARLYEIADFTASGKEKPVGGEDKSFYKQAEKGKVKLNPGQNPFQFSFAHGGIIPGYADGGVVANGIYNRDSVLARYADGGAVMLAGGEGVINASATSMIGPNVIDLINATGRLPASNDSGKYFADQNRVLMAGFNASVRTMEVGFRMLADRLDAIERRERIEASREPRRKASA